ncbi:hypothetical protein FISHEDRAFT_56378 [Fistulina hepatica ATCC 64428]|uniref:DUF6533 domain-containing protein n=1 Tax=Fistulina hepatica ATCC 64428 TaxID=1128425 RepID=A0A0D7AMA8_9AGAR|nr:hypothetical protein FISHEDRAFT_56378 [Fistulina hepatica ATCC 64428]
MKFTLSTAFALFVLLFSTLAISTSLERETNAARMARGLPPLRPRNLGRKQDLSARNSQPKPSGSPGSTCDMDNGLTGYKYCCSTASGTSKNDCGCNTMLVSGGSCSGSTPHTKCCHSATGTCSSGTCDGDGGSSSGGSSGGQHLCSFWANVYFYAIVQGYRRLTKTVLAFSIPFLIVALGRSTFQRSVAFEACGYVMRSRLRIMTVCWARLSYLALLRGRYRLVYYPSPLGVTLCGDPDRWANWLRKACTHSTVATKYYFLDSHLWVLGTDEDCIKWCLGRKTKGCLLSDISYTFLTLPRCAVLTTVKTPHGRLVQRASWGYGRKAVFVSIWAMVGPDTIWVEVENCSSDNRFRIVLAAMNTSQAAISSSSSFTISSGPQPLDAFRGTSTAMLVWALYDFSLCFNREVDLVWQQVTRWNLSKFLYLFIRYHTMGALIYYFIYALYKEDLLLEDVENLDIEVKRIDSLPCASRVLIQSTGVQGSRKSVRNAPSGNTTAEITSIAVGEALILLRINALFGRTRRFLVLTVFLFFDILALNKQLPIAEGIIGIVTSSITLSGGSSGLYGSTDVLNCSLDAKNVSDVNIAMWITSLTVACIFFALIVYKTHISMREIHTGGQIPLITLFQFPTTSPTLYICVRDSFVYFARYITNESHFERDGKSVLAARDAYLSLPSSCLIATYGVTSSRIFLNLKEAGVRRSNVSDVINMSALEFRSPHYITDSHYVRTVQDGTDLHML